jgi:hypothetical protein
VDEEGIALGLAEYGFDEFGGSRLAGGELDETTDVLFGDPALELAI